MIDIASRRELFVDRHLVAKLENAELRLHSPTPRDVSIHFDQPWEGRFCAFPTVFKDGDLYRMYYRGWPDDKGPSFTCLAQSSDGIHWERPHLGLHEVNGTRENNVLLIDSYTHSFVPFIDTRPGVSDEQRYKALAIGEGKPHALVAFASADGIRWNLMQNEPVLTKGGFDSQNLAFWSESENCYVAYYRYWSESPDWMAYRGKRSIARATSPDFIHWSDPVAMTFGDAALEELYTSQTTPYFRAPHIYIALPLRFLLGRTSPLTAGELAERGWDARYAKDLSEGVFMTSRGGNRYSRTFLEAFFRPGLDQGNWGSRGNMAALGVLPTGEHEMSVYYTQHYGQPSCHLLRASLRLDGFTSLRAGFAGGTMRTIPFTFTGDQLEINFSTAASGFIRIELQDEEARPIPGFTLDDCPEIYGDRISHHVNWNSRNQSLSNLAGKPVRMRVVLKDADLYSFRFH